MTLTEATAYAKKGVVVASVTWVLTSAALWLYAWGDLTIGDAFEGAFIVLVALVGALLFAGASLFGTLLAIAAVGSVVSFLADAWRRRG